MFDINSFVFLDLIFLFNAFLIRPPTYTLECTWHDRRDAWSAPGMMVSSCRARGIPYAQAGIESQRKLRRRPAPPPPPPLEEEEGEGPVQFPGIIRTAIGTV